MSSDVDELRALELVGFVQEAGARLRGADALLWREELERRYADCEWALSWLLDQGRVDDGLRLALALADFWQYTDRIGEGRQWFGRVLVALTVEESAAAEALYQAGLLAFWQGDDEAARSLHQQSLDLARRVSSSTGIALALTGLARIELRTGTQRSEALCLEALDIVAGTDDQRGQASALHVLGVTAQMAGDFLAARRWMSQRLQLALLMGDLRAVAGESGNLSMVERELGHYERAKELANEQLQLASERGDAWMIPYALNQVAAIAVAVGNYERAARLLSAAERMVTQQGAAWPPDEGTHFDNSRAAAAVALGPAGFRQAWSSGQALQTDELVAYALLPE